MLIAISIYLAIGFIYSIRGMFRLVSEHPNMGKPHELATAGVIAMVFVTIIWPWAACMDSRPNPHHS